MLWLLSCSRQYLHQLWYLFSDLEDLHTQQPEELRLDRGPDQMAGLFSKQAVVYAAARPAYPKDVFTKLAALTAQHRLAWDVGTGNGQAAIDVSISTPCSPPVHLHIY
jgi:hypothetical protein